MSSPENSDMDLNNIEFGDVFKVLIDLYNKKEEVIDDLKQCRINPTFKPDNFIRNDLDYYLP